ncbi:unnamed protein product, partial [Mesorhabditis belari]|uniref:Uncharacterized protein n=1 Tax=Mesorhabditis belari TaxID=2138241 RepID=A0AAF3EQ48_9BILA
MEDTSQSPQFLGVPLLDYFRNLITFDVEFEEDNRNYRCALQKFHILNVAKVFILLEVIFILFYMIVTFPWWFLWIFFHLPVVLLTVVALKKEIAFWILAKIVFIAFQIALYIMFICISFIVGISANAFLGIFGIGPIDNLAARWALASIIKINMVIVLLLLFWKFTIFWTLRIYFEKKQKDEVDLGADGDPNLLKRILTPI